MQIGLPGRFLGVVMALFVTGCSSDSRSSSTTYDPAPPITVKTSHDGIFKVQERDDWVSVTDEKHRVVLMQKSATPSFKCTTTEKALTVSDTNGLQIGVVPLSGKTDRTHPVSVASNSETTVVIDAGKVLINGRRVKNGNINVTIGNTSSGNAAQPDTALATNSDNVTKTWPCNNASHVINGDNDVIELRGNCTELTINGDSNIVTVNGKVKHVTFNGDDNRVQRKNHTAINCNFVDNGDGNSIVSGKGNRSENSDTI